jgi:hypothetical protein
MTELLVEHTVHFRRRGRSAPNELAVGAAPMVPVPPGRVPRVSRLMALALRFDGLLRTGTVKDQATLARLGGVTRSRISQILVLLHLAPDIQEALLFLPRVERGRAPLIHADLRPIAVLPDWAVQRRRWRALCRRCR